MANDELDEGKRLAVALVDHLTVMGASACLLHVVDRAVEHVVIVMPKEEYDKLPIKPIKIDVD